MAVLRILYYSFLNLLSFLNSIKWKIFRAVGFVISISVFILGLSAYVVWIKEKPNVKANLDKYRSEVSTITIPLRLSQFEFMIKIPNSLVNLIDVISSQFELII